MFLIFLILLVIFFFVAIARSKRRAGAWQELCRRYNFQCEGSSFSFFSSPITISPYWRFFRLFSRGHSHKVIYRARGEYRGHSIEIFDYQYTTGSGRSRQTHYFTPMTCFIPGRWKIFLSIPELKASRNFLELQTELANTEDRIQAARRFYNGNVREYNILAKTFPSRIVASFSGAEPREYFKIDRTVSGVNPEIRF